MNALEKSRRAGNIDQRIFELDKQLEFMESIEEWSDADGKRYDQLLEEREELQDEYDAIVRGIL